MKIQEISMATYTAYVLDDASREKLIDKFPPKYPKFIGHHITVQSGISPNTTAPELAITKVIGYADSGDGLETLVVSVNGSVDRKDGSVYHITWSLDPSKYSPKDSNTLLAQKDKAKRFTLTLPVTITTKPEVL